VNDNNIAYSPQPVNQKSGAFYGFYKDDSFRDG
jgi:hypothetical protein